MRSITYNLIESHELSDSSVSIVSKNTYRIFQFSNDGINDINLKINCKNSDVLSLTFKSGEQFNMGDSFTLVPPFNSIDILQNSDGKFRLWLIKEIKEI